MSKGLNVLTFIIGVAFAAQVNGANYPFPQNQAVAFGSYYPNYNNADVQAAYNKWYTEQVTSTGAGGYLRVQRNGDPTLQPNSTVSEGIGYGMVIAVYMNNQNLFDNLWNYEQLHLGGNGLMNWYISADGTQVLGSGGATDADEDMAWALVMAHYQWGTAAYGPIAGKDYLTLANSQISLLLSNYIDSNNYVMPWAGGSSTVNISYFDPSEYRVFAQVSGVSRWNSVADTCYTLINNSLNATNGNANNGLVPAWCTPAGVPTPGFSGAPTWYQYDSCRTPFRIAKDYFYFGDARALAYIQKTTSFFTALGANSIGDGYNLDGTRHYQYWYSSSTAESAAFIGPAGVGCMATNTNPSFTQGIYNNLATLTELIGGRYYDESWTVMSLLMMSGNFLNYVPTPTPTPTPDACQYHQRIKCAGGPYTDSQGFTWVADQAYSTGGFGYVNPPATSVGTSGGPITGSSDPNLYLSERYGTTVEYKFTVPWNGSYQVKMRWAETYFSSAGQRVFSVSMNGTSVVNNLDLFAASGGKNIAYDQTYTVNVTSGVIDIVETASANNATIMGIEVVGGPLCTPTVSPTPTPAYSHTNTPTRTVTPSISLTFSASPTATPSATISPTFTASFTPDACQYQQRINCAGAQYTDTGGKIWVADQAYSSGGFGYVSAPATSVGTSTGPISGTNDQALYLDERYGGQVEYKFTVPNGSYQVLIKLAETYHTGPGQRVFNIAINGNTVVSNLDLYAASGGKNIAYDLSFGVTANSGLIDILETASVDNATVMAIQVVGGPRCSPTASPSPVPGTPSFTHTPSASPTYFSPSASYSSTPSVTVTFSPSASPTQSETLTPTLSFSITSSPSASDTWTATLTKTPTISVSPSNSPSAASSASFTPSLSASRTSQASFTASPTLSAQASFTASLTASNTNTPAASFTTTPLASFSASSTALLTLTQSPSATFSPVSTPQTFSPTPSFSTVPATQTFRPSPTASFSPAPASPSRTASLSPVVSPSATISAAPTQTLSANPSPTLSYSPVPASPTWTAFFSPVASPSSTYSFTFSSTASPTCTLSPSVTASMTSSPTPSPNNIVSLTPSLTPAGNTSATGTSTALVSPVASPQTSLTSSPNYSGFIPRIVKVVPVPNPGPDKFLVLLSTATESLKFKLYSVDMKMLGQAIYGPSAAGWYTVDARGLSGGLAKGTYFLKAVAQNDAGSSDPSMAKFFILK